MKRRNISVKITMAGVLAVAASMGFSIAKASAADAMSNSKSIVPVTTPTPVPKLRQDILMPRAPMTGDLAIAKVNGIALSKEHFLNSLLRLNGLGLLQKWIQLTVLKQACEKDGLHIDKSDIDAAETKQLAPLSAQLAAQHIPASQLMPVLEKLLARKGQSLAEFRLDIARQTYMLALAKGHVQVTDAQVEQAFKDNFGPKVQVRDIVVSSFDDAATVRHLIMDKHEDPATVQHSIDRQTAANGGLQVIPLEDKALPQVLLDTVTDLQPGQLSAAVPINGSLHLLWLVKKIPAADVTLEKVKVSLKADLLEQMKLRWGQVELNRLVAQAQINIDNPILNKEFTGLREAYAEQAKLLKTEKQGQQTPATSAPATTPHGKAGK